MFLTVERVCKGVSAQKGEMDSSGKFSHSPQIRNTAQNQDSNNLCQKPLSFHENAIRHAINNPKKSNSAPCFSREFA